MRFHTAVNQFCWRAVSGQPLEVWQTASHQFRPYLDLSDAVRAMIFTMRRRQFDARVYNVLTLNATVAHVVDVLSAIIPDLQISYVDSPLMNRLCTAWTTAGSRNWVSNSAAASTAASATRSPCSQAVALEQPATTGRLLRRVCHRRMRAHLELTDQRNPARSTVSTISERFNWYCRFVMPPERCVMT